MNILVTGSTGYIGGRLVPRLLQAGHQIRVFARDPSRLRGHPWATKVEVTRGDVLKPATIPAAMAGIDVAYYLIHSMSQGEQGFSDRDRRAAEAFGQAAREAGVKRIIYLGGLGDEQEALSHHLRSRHETGEVLRQSGVPVTEFRAAIIVGSGSISFEMVRYLTERLPIMITPRWVSTRCQPIAIRDVLAYMIQALERPESAGRIIEIGCPAPLTYGKMMKIYSEVRGLTRYLIPVPFLTPRLSSYWVNIVTPVPAALARPLIEGLSSEVIVHNPIAQEIFPDIRPISYRRAVELALQRVERKDVETIWSSALSAQANPDGTFKRLTTTEGFIIERRQRPVAASREQLFRVIEGIGGKRGWYYANSLWWMRGMLDRFVGGPGLRRGRRDPDHLREGEALDFWRVEALEPGQLLRLRAEMKVPGKAWLQLEARTDTDGQQNERTIFHQTAFFEPHGLGGFLYWYALYPLHTIIFSGMSRSIAEHAEGKRVEQEPTWNDASAGMSKGFFAILFGLSLLLFCVKWWRNTDHTKRNDYEK